MDIIEVKKIKCPICGAEKCYQDEHLDDNDQFIIKEWLCYGCGYTSTSDYTVEDCKYYEERMPKTVVALKCFDKEHELNWYPCVITTIKGYIFPELSAEDWHWFSAPIVELDKTNINKLPKDSDAKVGDCVIALWLGTRYKKEEFEIACRSLNLVIQRHKELRN